MAIRGTMMVGAPEWKSHPLAGTGQSATIALVTTAIGPRREPREILVALPPKYARSERTYPVLYLHDGQNLFDPETSHAGDWGLATRLNRLARKGIEAVVVGIPNRGRFRKYDYNPFRDIAHGGGGGDRYLEFVVEQVKPLIDRSFRVRTEPAHTIMGGSSLGGLISFYALYRHPDVFGVASVQSPALWVANRAIFRFLGQQRTPPRGRVYLDVGTAEGSETVSDVRALRDWLLKAGARDGRDLQYVEEAGGEHTEAAWGSRLEKAFPWLLGRK
jgi:predicted alpha/beta superfamily hydrolase